MNIEAQVLTEIERLIHKEGKGDGSLSEEGSATARRAAEYLMRMITAIPSLDTDEIIEYLLAKRAEYKSQIYVGVILAKHHKVNPFLVFSKMPKEKFFQIYHVFRHAFPYACLTSVEAIASAAEHIHPIVIRDMTSGTVASSMAAYYAGKCNELERLLEYFSQAPTEGVAWFLCYCIHYLADADIERAKGYIVQFLQSGSMMLCSVGTCFASDLLEKHSESLQPCVDSIYTVAANTEACDESSRFLSTAVALLYTVCSSQVDCPNAREYDALITDRVDANDCEVKYGLAVAIDRRLQANPLSRFGLRAEV